MQDTYETYKPNMDPKNLHLKHSKIESYERCRYRKVSALGGGNFGLGFPPPDFLGPGVAIISYRSWQIQNVQKGPQETSPDVRMHTNTHTHLH